MKEGEIGRERDRERDERDERDETGGGREGERDSEGEIDRGRPLLGSSRLPTCHRR